jgi:hypothetical protein
MNPVLAPGKIGYSLAVTDRLNEWCDEEERVGRGIGIALAHTYGQLDWLVTRSVLHPVMSWGLRGDLGAHPPGPCDFIRVACGS